MFNILLKFDGKCLSSFSSISFITNRKFNRNSYFKEFIIPYIFTPPKTRINFTFKCALHIK